MVRTFPATLVFKIVVFTSDDLDFAEEIATRYSVMAKWGRLYLSVGTYGADTTS
jgi:hypothetical protein